MYRFDIVAFGKLSDRFAAEGCETYLKRMKPYASVSMTELAVSPVRDESPAAVSAALEREGRAVLQRLPQGAALVALCVEGQAISSERFASYLSGRAGEGCSRFVFAIGSSHGLSDEVKNAAELKLSLSAMTFPHELARLMLCEQLYRALTIINNLKYHK